MPIKFACPQCKNVLQVSSQMAGKTGKCKCGAQIKIPIPKSAAARPAQPKMAGAAAPAGQTAPSASTSANMFDELTDGDFGREDPHTELYTGKKVNNDAQSLGRFTKEVEEEKEKELGQARGLMTFAAILNLIGSIGFMVLTVLLVVVSSFLTDVEGVAEAFPILGVGLAIAITWCGCMAVLFLVSAVGGMMRTSWGWITMALVYTYAVVDRLVGLGMSFTDGFEMARFFGQFIGLLAMVSLTAFIYKESTREMCHVTSKVPAIVAAVLGVLLALGTWGAIFAIGSEAVRQAEAAELNNVDEGNGGEEAGY